MINAQVHLGSRSPISAAGHDTRHTPWTVVAKVNRLALLKAPNGVLIDLSFAAFPFEQEVLDRSSLWQVTPDIQLNTCSAEDLIILSSREP